MESEPDFTIDHKRQGVHEKMLTRKMTKNASVILQQPRGVNFKFMGCEVALPLPFFTDQTRGLIEKKKLKRFEILIIRRWANICFYILGDPLVKLQSSKPPYQAAAR